MLRRLRRELPQPVTRSVRSFAWPKRRNCRTGSPPTSSGSSMRLESGLAALMLGVRRGSREAPSPHPVQCRPRHRRASGSMEKRVAMATGEIEGELDAFVSIVVVRSSQLVVHFVHKRYRDAHFHILDVSSRPSHVCFTTEGDSTMKTLFALTTADLMLTADAASATAVGTVRRLRPRARLPPRSIRRPHRQPALACPMVVVYHGTQLRVGRPGRRLPQPQLNLVTGDALVERVQCDQGSAMALRRHPLFPRLSPTTTILPAWTEALGIAQRALSQQIRVLETEIGVQPFHRVPRGAELTAAGDAFQREARLALASDEERCLGRAARASRRERTAQVGRHHLVHLRCR